MESVASPRALSALEYDKIIGKIADKAKSSQGQKAILQIQPLKDKIAIETLLSMTDAAYSFINYKGFSPLNTFFDVNESLKRIQKGTSVLSAGEIGQIGKNMHTAMLLKKSILEYAECKEPLLKLANNIAVDKNLYERIENSVSQEGEIYDTASLKLTEIIRSLKRLNEKIKDKLSEIISSKSFEKYLQEPIVTMRSNRYVIPVKQEFRGQVQGLIHDESSSGATLFIEPLAVLEINNEMRQLEAQKREEIERILQELTALIDLNSKDLLNNERILLTMDIVFSKAAYARENDSVKPEFSQGEIIIKNARHPLIEKDSVVPISLTIEKDINGLLITGPNTGGKTVTLKTVGLFSLMFQSGMFLPAYEVKLPLFNSVYADIGDEQSIEQSLSTFSSHMKNIINIIGEMDENSLLLLDELGSGTDPTEGAALAMSIMDTILLAGSRVLSTTHYSQLKAYVLNKKELINASMEFDIKTLQPTFRLLIGTPGSSNAFEISKKLGLKDDIIEKARDYLSSEDISFEEAIANAQLARVEAEKERQNAVFYREEADRVKSLAQKEQKEITKKAQEILDNAKIKANDIIIEAQNSAETVIKELKKLQKENSNSSLQKDIDNARNSLKEKQEEYIIDLPKNSETLKTVKPGEDVFVKSMRKPGVVLKEPDNKNNVLVQVGIMRLSVPLSDLTKGAKTTVKKETKSAPRQLNLNTKNVSQRLDIRGKNVEEAIEIVDQYLDDAFLSGLSEVLIVHGKGTGVLRSGIQNHLRGHMHVKSFRLGKFGEGEDGVSIIELK